MDINQLKSKLENLNPNIYHHCVSTMEESEKLASIYNVDIEKARIAGLLHDCAKKMIKGQDNLTHSKSGAEMARNIFGINDEEILNAITYHTTGRENMTLLEKIIFIADKIEPRRSYEGVEELREIAYNNIDLAIIKSLESTISYVKKRNLELDIDSVNTLEFLRRQNEQPRQ